MGGGGQANSGQASQAAAQQTAASNQDMALSKQYGTQQQQLFDKLFGPGAKGGGTLSGMMNPASLNTGAPTGAYKTAWNNAQDQIGSNFANERGTLAQAFANGGATSRSTPNGFQADQMSKLSRGEADTRGSTYTGLVGQQHQDALNNFWNANNLAAGQQASATSGSTQGAGNSGSSSAALYGTAGQYHPSQFGSIAGSALQAGGTVGAGMAQHCPCVGSMILMADGTEKTVAEIKVGDSLRGVAGGICAVTKVTVHLEPSLYVETSDGCNGAAAMSHAFVTGESGFAIAFEALGIVIATKRGHSRVTKVGFIGKQRVFDIRTDGDHSYRADGLWAWGVGDVASDNYLATEAIAAHLELAGE